jgi:hypothetical protein
MEVAIMTTDRQSIAERIAARLDAFNRRLEARLRRNQELLENMRAEEDFRRSMEYFKEFFQIKGGN